MLLSAVYVLVVAQSSSKFPEGLMNNPVLSSLVAVERITSQLPQEVHGSQRLAALVKPFAVLDVPSYI